MNPQTAARLLSAARWIVFLCFVAAVSASLCAQDTGSSTPPAENPGGPETLFPHPDSTRWWISGQANIIFQWHPAFPAKYSGPNSLTAPAQSATTHILTLFTGFQLTHTTEILADLEDATGGGIGGALGLGGITDLDDVRTVQGVQLSRAPYLARLMLHQIIPLSSERAPATRGPMGLATSLPVRRIEFRIGKFDLADFFDNNSGGSDSHLQFLNWTVDNNGAWDYAANTRGYTDGAILEYDDHNWSVRFAEAMMPKIANGINLDADLLRAHSENVEGQYNGSLIPKRAGVVRVLGYVNHANMGSYRQAIVDFLDGETSTPNIVATRMQGRVKYGFGVNLEQELTSQIAVFARFGWNDGRNESFVYTEVDETVELGGWVHGEKWRRPLDKFGLAFVSNGISKDHQEYLRLGGLGFLLGDGNLNYGRENILETFYNAHFWRGLYGAFNLQYIADPGYNRDRGPVVVPGLRFHVEF
ncbi:MAG: carbohydrate porin [Candidatus Acidiferrales bacterium]